MFSASRVYFGQLHWLDFYRTYDSLWPVCCKSLYYLHLIIIDSLILCIQKLSFRQFGVSHWVSYSRIQYLIFYSMCALRFSWRRISFFFWYLCSVTAVKCLILLSNQCCNYFFLLTGLRVRFIVKLETGRCYILAVFVYFHLLDKVLLKIFYKWFRWCKLFKKTATMIGNFRR